MTVKEFVVSVPSDLFNQDDMTDSEILRSLGHQAIAEAEELAEDYVCPCKWEARHSGGDLRQSWEIEFKVTRYSN